MESNISTETIDEPILKGFGHLDNYIIKATTTTPRVYLVPEKKYLLVKGKSFADSSDRFYSKLIDLLKVYATVGQDSLTVYFNLNQINTSSLEGIFKVLRKLEELQVAGMNIDVNWYYELDDDYIHDVGARFKELFRFEINLQPSMVNVRSEF